MAGRRALIGMVRRRALGVGVLACAAMLVPPATAAGLRRVARHVKGVRPARPVAPTVHGTRGTEEEHVHVQRGETLGGLLAARGVGAAEARGWVAAAAGAYDLRQLRPRRGVTLRFDRATRALEAITYEIDDRSLLVVERSADGINARRAPLPYYMEVKGAAGRIDRGLREDAAAAGVPGSVVSELAEIFGWELDVANDLQTGDEFRVLYENIWQVGEARPEAGKVLGAEIVTGGRPITAVLFEDEDGRGAYYRPTGDPLSRDFLRYPVEFTEISSDFSLVRRHPILHVRRPHLGVDLAAPVGTPVRAVASGTVEYSGWGRWLGRSIRIAHSGALESTYGHLSRIAAGLAPGAAVERGQVIGYVGATGLATGPHLHFAMDRDGQYLDPLALTAAAGRRIPDAARRLFDRVQNAVTRQLAALPRTANPLTVSLSAVGLPRE